MGFYQQGNNGTVGSAISLPAGVSFGTTMLGSHNYSTLLLINSQEDNEFKLFVTGSQNKWNPEGFGSKGQLDIPANAMFVSNQGIAMGSAGNGTLTLDIWTNTGDTTAKSFILDLSSITDLQSYAFYGNLDVTGSVNGSAKDYSNKTVDLKLGGKGIKGNVNLNSLGNVNLFFGNGTSIDGNLTVSKGNNTIFTNQANKEVTELFLANTTTLNGGTLYFGFDSSVTNSADKVFNVDTSSIASKISSNVIVFNGGNIGFNGAKTVYFNSSNTTGQGDGTLTLNNGGVSFIVDPTITTTSDKIFKGNIETTSGSIVFTLKGATSGVNPFDTNTANDDPSSLATYTFDGSITGGLSAFWDDQYGFTAKIDTSKITLTGGLIGKNDVWFSGAQTFSSIQATSGGTSHLVFDGAITISGGDGNNIAIKSNGNSAKILFLGDTTIEGSIVALTKKGYGASNIIKTKNLTLGKDGGQSYIYAGIPTQEAGWGNTNNRIEINGTTTLKGNIGIIADRNANWTNTTDTEQNIIKFNGNVNGGSGVISEITARNGPRKYSPLGKAYNILSFESGGSVTIGDINKDSTSTFWGNNNYNYIGKALTIGSGENLALNTSLFAGDTWKSTDHQANITMTVTGEINSHNVKNYINVYKLNAQNINANAKSGVNNIVVGAGGGSITGSIQAQGGGTNKITFGGTTNKILKETSGTISACNGGTNNINANNATLTIGGDTNRISLVADEGGVNGINTITADSLTAYFGSITAGTHGGWARYTNTITANSGTINIDSLGTDFYRSSTLTNNITTNNITLKSGTLTIGSISSNGGYGRKSANEFFLGSESGSVTANINGNITTSGNGGQTNFTLLGDGTTLTLKGQSNQISTLDASSGNNVLLLDTDSKNNSTSIDTLSNGNNLEVQLAGDSTYSATLELKGNSTIKTLALTEATSSADKNILSLNHANTTTIQSEVEVGAGKNLKLDFANNATLELDNGITTSGTTTINIADNRTATIAGIINTSGSGANNVTFAGTGSLTLQGSENILSSITSTTAGTLNLDSTSNDVNAVVKSVADNKLGVKFTGSNDAVLRIEDGASSSKTISLTKVELENNSTNNTLDLSALTTASINNTSAVTVGANQGLTIKLANTNLTFANGLDSNNGGTTTIRVDGGSGSASSSLTATSGSLNITNLDMIGSGTTTLVLKSSAEIGTLTAQASAGSTLEIDSSNATAPVGTPTLTVTAHTLNGVIGVKYKGDHNGDLVINGGTHTLSSITFDGTNVTGTLTLKDTNTTIASAISLSGSNTLDLTLTNSSLKLSGATNTISSLTATDGKSVIDLATTAPRGKAGDRKTLTISDYKQGNNAKFIVYADTRSADKVIFSASNGTTADTTASISVIGGTDLFNASYVEGGSNNVMIADAKPNGTKANINIQGGESYIGGVLTVAEIVEGTNTDEGKYYIGKIEDRGLAQPYQEIANTALTVNYDLYLANFNSLNKRMGELRDNPHSNGVWVRVFGGNMSNDFGAGSKTNYITAQAGYDYSFSVGENAKNYSGVAVAYGKSWTKSNDVSTGNIINGVGTFSLDKVDSNMVEVGIYNSYVADSGWYNDSILKFDYIMSEFSLSNDPTMSKTNNFAMVLSNEVGYRYKFAENEKGNWYIDPQVEIAFGYFNQSDFNQALNSATQINITQDTILTLRSRAGLSLGKKFVTEKGFASIYVGASYEYDYIEGGGSEVVLSSGKTNPLNGLESNGRAIVNVGSNIGLSESARLYIDVEKSFGDKQRTFMQFNFGARYSF